MITIFSVKNREYRELMEEAKKEKSSVVRAIAITMMVICKFLSSMRTNLLMPEEVKKEKWNELQRRIKEGKSEG